MPAGSGWTKEGAKQNTSPWWLGELWPSRQGYMPSSLALAGDLGNSRLEDEEVMSFEPKKLCSQPSPVQ